MKKFGCNNCKHDESYIGDYGTWEYYCKKNPWHSAFLCGQFEQKEDDGNKFDTTPKT